MSDSVGSLDLNKGGVVSDPIRSGPVSLRHRFSLAKSLLDIFFIITLVTLFMVYSLVYSGIITVENSVTILLTVSSIFSGLLGSAVNYYFSKQK